MKNANKLAIGFSTLGLMLAAPSTQATTLSIEDGSAWACECSPNFFLWTAMQSGPDGGIILGQAQAASGSHSSPPDGSESPGIDNPWNFFGNTGMHLTTSPVNVLSHVGNTMTLDFSGWGLTWNGHDFVPLDSGSWGGVTDGIAQITCAVDCADGDSYQLYYNATIPVDSPTGFNGVRYQLAINGTVSAVPIPASIWLFSTGMLVFSGMAKQKRTKSHTH